MIVFDPAQIADRSTFDDGKTLAVGMDHVLVNGVAVLTDGKRTQGAFRAVAYVHDELSGKTPMSLSQLA